MYDLIKRNWLLLLVCCETYFLVCVLAIFQLLTYDEGKYIYMLPSIVAIIKVMWILIVLYVLSILFDIVVDITKWFKIKIKAKNDRLNR
jgi:hypothetical protein